MSRPPNPPKTPSIVPTPRPADNGGVEHSGSGADTALVAMLKKRLMRAKNEAEPAAPGTPKPPGP